MKLKFWEKTKGFFEAMKSVIPKHDRPDWQRFDFQRYCDTFDNYIANHTDLKAGILTIAGIGTADGVFVKPAGDYPRAEEATEVIRKFNKRVKIRKLVYNTMIRMATYGTCFWEKDFQDIHGLNVQLVPHQRYMTPHWNKATGNLDQWHYRYWGQTKISWSLDQVAVFPWNVGRNDPYGTSLLTGIDLELDTKHNIIKNLNAYLEKQAFASNVLQVGDGNYMPDADEVTTIEKRVRNREVGEDFVTSYPTNLQVMGAASIETRMIPDTLDFVEDRIQDALLVPLISKLYNSTEASAKEMTKWCRAVIISPMQNIISEVVEEQVYEPYLEDLGYSVRVVPELSFEPPEPDLTENAEYVQGIVQLVQAKVISRLAAAEKLGFGEEYERDKMDKWDDVQMQQPMMQPEEEERFEEWVVRKKRNQKS